MLVVNSNDLLKLCVCRVWGCILVVPLFRRLRQEELTFKARLGYTVRLSQNKKQIK
jgi:hypothetical protein